MARENTMIHMLGTVSGTAATIDIPDDGLLLSSTIGITIGAGADGDGHSASLEFGSTSAVATNDARTIIARVRIRHELTTSGSIAAHISNHFDYGEGIRVFGGERIFLHNVALAGTFVDCWALLLFNFATFVARRR
jgi:hypothetical protein